MNNQYKNFTNKVKEHKILLQNFSYLSALQIFNLILPLITYPYLIRVLGKETYGLVVFAQAIVAYLVLLVNFGFNISATREISIYRDDKEKLSEIVSSILIIKGTLFLFSCIIMGVLVMVIPQAQGYENLFLLSLWACLYDVIFPMWYFQGIEQMKYITYISLISRLVFLALIFIFIHTPSDYIFVPIFYGLGALIAGILALIIIFRKHQIHFIWQNYERIKYYFKGSIPIFISNFFISIYVYSNKVIIGAYIGLSEVAYFDLAEKITSVLKIPQNILSQSLFPKISKEKNIKFIRKVFNISIITNTIMVIVSILLSNYIVLAIGGSQMTKAVVVLNIILLTIPFIVMSNTFGIQLLIPFGFKKEFKNAYIFSSFFYLAQILIFRLISDLTIVSLSISLLNTEIFVAVYFLYLCRKNISNFKSHFYFLSKNNQFVEESS